MSEAKHTPGPWEARHGGETVGRLVERPGKSRKFVAVCHCYPLTIWDREDMGIPAKASGNEIMAANARLIAASPDLLEACKAMVREMVAADWHGEAMEEAREAIARAEGASS
jgi:hypothetical protein